MSRRKDTLPDLFQAFLNQSPPPTEPTMKYVAALCARIDVLEFEKALLNQRVITLTTTGPKIPS